MNTANITASALDRVSASEWAWIAKATTGMTEKKRTTKQSKGINNRRKQK